MPIYQTNVFVCEVCGKVESSTKKVEIFDDPVIVSPSSEEWDIVRVEGKERFACPDCVSKYGATELKGSA